MAQSVGRWPSAHKVRGSVPSTEEGNQVWWYLPVIPALGEWRLGDRNIGSLRLAWVSRAWSNKATLWWFSADHMWV